MKKICSLLTITLVLGISSTSTFAKKKGDICFSPNATTFSCKALGLNNVRVEQIYSAGYKVVSISLSYSGQSHTGYVAIVEEQ